MGDEERRLSFSLLVLEFPIQLDVFKRELGQQENISLDISVINMVGAQSRKSTGNQTSVDEITKFLVFLTDILC